jgi:hypothetical protein
MTPLFKKLNFKDHKVVLVLNAPSSFVSEMREMEAFSKVVSELKRVDSIGFVMAFATKQAEVDAFAGQIIPILEAKAVLWFCYPKQSSKLYKCDFNRDNGWEALGRMDMEPVRMVAIDEDWSALRFRKVEDIKKFNRGFAISEEGKKRMQK